MNRIILFILLIFLGSSQLFAQVPTLQYYPSSPYPGYISPPPLAPPVNSDEEITKRVENSLRDNPALGNTILRVSTYEGVVTLDGTVRTQSQLDMAVSTARNVAGVESVVSNIAVQEEGPIQ